MRSIYIDGERAPRQAISWISESGGVDVIVS
jgi:hypothetical protein